MYPTEEAELEEEDTKIVKAFDEVGGSKDCLSASKSEFGPLMEAMVSAYCEEAHRRKIKKLDVDRKISKKFVC